MISLAKMYMCCKHLREIGHVCLLLPTLSKCVVMRTDSSCLAFTLIQSHTIFILLANKVTVTFDQDEVKPGDNINLEVTAEANSYVGILAIDTSVMLLKTGNDITQNQVGQRSLIE